MINSIFLAVLGGSLIGLAASLLLVTTGRIAGISGIIGGLLLGSPDRKWRYDFLFGLMIGGVALFLLQPNVFSVSEYRSVSVISLAGLFVGFGVRMGNGCTSGHGVCGITRFSKRSIIATISFMFTGMLTASFIEIFLGGSV